MLFTTTFYCQGLATGRWFSSGTLVYFTNNTDHQDITEILLKVALHTTALTLNLIFNPINIIYEIDLYHVHAVYTCIFSPYISHFTTVCVSFNQANLGSSPDRNKPKTLKLVFVASPLSM